jgi:hypothetical protein
VEYAEHRITAHFRHERFTAEDDHTRSRLLCVRQNLRKIQVVCQDDIAMLARMIKDFAILGRCRTD